jgi:hypothetical protein
MDYTGRQFERLTVIKDLGIRDLLCRCQCGNVKIVQRSKLENGHTKSCGCFRIERARLGVRKRYPDAGYRRAYSAKKSFAKIRRIGFKLTFEQFKSVIVQDCHYCGKPPGIRTLNDRSFIGAESLDRKDSDGIYEINNVVACCLSCNVRKGDSLYEDYKRRVFTENYDFELAA